MTDWEYRKVDLNLHRPQGDELDLLNAAGTEGRELVAITSNQIAYLKRKLQEPVPAPTVHAHNATRIEGKGGSVQEGTVKYRDPVTHETWSGRGRMPHWLKRKQEIGEGIDKYLVDRDSE